MSRSGFSLLLLIGLVGVEPAQSCRPRDLVQPVPVIGTPSPVQRIGLDANPKTSSNYRVQDWVESVNLMRTTGANHLHYGRVWSELERSPGIYDTTNVSFMMQQSAPLPVAFNLRLLDAGARNMADEYKALKWDSPEMIEHVTQVVEKIAPILGTRPWSYAIGNEIDLYFASRPAEIGAYARMLLSVKDRVRALHPAASFTTSFQFLAALQLRSVYAPIVAVLDHVTFTYYPLAADFTVRPESSITADLQTMIDAARPLPIFLQEIGYPTAVLLGSSPERQRAFVQLAFEAIRAAGSARVFGATYLFQADLPDWFVNEIVLAYGNNSAGFRAFVSTLGLRDERDRPRPAWDEFIRQAALIGSRR